MIHLKTLFFFTTVFLFLVAVFEPAVAFKGIGSSTPGEGEESIANMAKMQHQGGKDIVVALVNGAEIKMGALMSTVMNVIMLKYGGQEVTSEIAKQIRQEALERLATEELAYQRAEVLGITISPEQVNSRIDSLALKAGGEEAFKNSLIKQNKTLEQLKEETHRYLSIKAVIEREVNSMATINREDVEKIYQENRDQFIIPEQVIITDIIFFLDHEDEASKIKVESTRQKIINSYNNNPTIIPPESFVVKSDVKISKKTAPDLYGAAITMQPGEISSPLLIDSTFHLIRLDHYQPATEKPEKEIKKYIAGALVAEKRERVLDEWRQNLLKNGKIEIVHELLQ